jgi:O-antigen/teichoic acid export membrane protein
MSDTNETASLGRRAMTALFWSIAQSWGGRALGLVVFIILARLVTPSQFGLASAAFLILSVLMMLAEFGLGDALVQRPNLQPREANLPFYACIVLSLMASVLAALNADRIAGWMGGMEGLSPVIIAIGAISPLATLSLFQEALYRRELRFRELAMRTFGGTLLGGVVGIAMALAGFGTWALIAQYAAQVLVSTAWLWTKRVWTPSLELDVGSFRALGMFGLNVATTRMLDFVTLRAVDVVILTVYGPTSLGLFAAGSRIYQVLLQLLQASLSSVALSTLSKVAHNKASLARLFLRTSSLSASFGTPAFFGLAAIAPEASTILFGEKWHGVDGVMQPLLLVGGIQCIQFVNGAYLMALGQPRSLLQLVIFKGFLVLVPLYFFRMPDVQSTAMLFACSLLASTPLSFDAILRSLSLRWVDLARSMGGLVLASIIGFAMVALLRHSADGPAHIYVRTALFAVAFAVTFAGSAAVLAFRPIRENVSFLLRTAKR